ncbi:P4 protein [Emaravirus idaeobati]|uniref:p4 protein n=1 Tax=Emaravirus idaeobati TaxID=1980431 RepID=F8K9Z0_9VIRU|nr:P4 protein [Emaravirus idaeobati]CBZ42027.1 P4 protein [Emaravirus idaeobati]
MKAFRFYASIFSFAFFSYALPTGGVMELDTSELDGKVESHDVSAWESGASNVELSQAIVNGLASTKLKTDLVVSPKTSVLDFQFYKLITQYLKTLKGIDAVRLASIILHYQPYSDECKGTVSYALVDTRFGDVMDAESHAPNVKGKNVAKVVGKVKYLVTVDCSKEAFIQFSMTHQVAVSDINKIKMCQIVSGVDMIKGKMAKLNMGWFTVPGESTIYTPFPAQLFYFPRRSLPELQGKSADYTFNKFVKMAESKYDREVAMLNNLQKLVDSQNIISNNLNTNIENEISSADGEIKKLQSEIEMMEKALPNKYKLGELKNQVSELRRIKDEKLKEIMNEKNEFLEDLRNGQNAEPYKIEINDNNSVDFSNILG